MTQGEDDQDKEHEASPQRLIEARKQGDVPKSNDLLVAVSIGGFLLGMFTLGHWVAERAGTAGMLFLAQADRLSLLSDADATDSFFGLALAMAGPPLALLVFPPCLVLAVLIVTRGFAVAPVRLAPRLARISPVALARQKFGVEGLVEFGKSALKLCLVSAVLYLFLVARLQEIVQSLHQMPNISSVQLMQLTKEFLLILLGLGLTMGIADLLWQQHLFRSRNRMSRREVMDEFKENEGDPHLKSTRRQRAQEVATNRMLSDVARADVVVVNPTHYAVALCWVRTKGKAPVCVAKGMDEIAQRIRERAIEHGIPIHSDPPTARAIHATVEIGAEIRVEHYRAIAAAIRFADAMRRKARKR